MFLLKRDTRILLLAGGIIFILVMMYKNDMIKQAVQVVTLHQGAAATPNNFMGNKLMSNYQMGPQSGIPSNSMQMWQQVHPFAEDAKFSQSNFFKMPSNDLSSFLKGTYPSMFEPSCRDDTTVCDPDARPAWINSRGPARTNNGMY